MIKRVANISLLLGIILLFVSITIHISVFMQLVAAFLLACGITLLIFGVARMRLSFFMHNICRLPDTEKFIALTFDDGPDKDSDELLDLLDRYNVKATFFCTGRNASMYPKTLQRIIASGHTVGSHTFNHHNFFPLSGFKGVYAEVRGGAVAIHNLIGKNPLLFRPPYGVTNPVIARAVKACNLISIGWDIRSFDTTVKSSEIFLKKIIPRLKPGSILLLHDRVRITREVLPVILQEIEKRGLVPVTLEEGLKMKVYE